MVNKVILVGRLGADPILKSLDGGNHVCNFSIVTSEHWKDHSGEKVERATWHRIVTWSKLAEICGAHLRKGRLVYVEGKIQTREYQDKSGEKKQAFEIVAETVQFLGDQKKEDSDGFSGMFGT